MKQKKREAIAEISMWLAIATAYSPLELGVDVFRRTGTEERSAKMRAILISTDMRDQIIKLLCERL